MNVNKTTSENTFIISDTLCYCNSNFAMYKRNDLSLDELSTDSLHVGTLHITTLNTKIKLIEGNFEFKAINKNLHDSVTVTNGRFSLYYD